MPENPIKKTIGDNGIYFISFALTSLAVAISIPIFTRLFNPREYGYLSLTFITISLLTILASGPISSSIVRFLPKFEGKDEKEFYKISFILTLISTLVVSSFYLVGLALLKPRLNMNLFKLLIFCIVIMITMAPFNIFLSIFRARQDSKQYGFFTVLNKYISLFIGLYFVIILSQGVMGILLGMFISLIFIDFFIYARYFKKKIKFKKNHISKDIIYKIISYSLPLLASLLCQWILCFSDRYIIEFFKGSFEVGIYSIGYDLSFQSMNLLILPFITALLPTIITSWEKNRNEAEYNLKKLSRYFFMITIPALIGFNALSKPIIQIFTTPQYYKGRLIFPFISIGTFFMGTYSISYTGLIIYEKTKLIAKLIVISGIFNIVLNLLLIPYYGFIGAGISTMTAYFGVFLLADRASSIYIDWKPALKSVIKILLASSIMGIIVYFLGTLLTITLLNLILEITIGCIVYFYFLYMFRGIEKKEISEIKIIFKNTSKKYYSQLIFKNHRIKINNDEK